MLHVQSWLYCYSIPLQRDSYIGFSLATSYSMSYSGEPTYIAGAPRGNFTGAIIMYKKTMSKICDVAVFLLKQLVTGSDFTYCKILEFGLVGVRALWG